MNTNTNYIDPRIAFENGFRAFFQGVIVCNDKTLGLSKVFPSGEVRPTETHFVAGWKVAKSLPGWYSKSQIVDELLEAAADYAETVKEL